MYGHFHGRIPRDDDRDRTGAGHPARSSRPQPPLPRRQHPRAARRHAAVRLPRAHRGLLRLDDQGAHHRHGGRRLLLHRLHPALPRLAREELGRGSPRGLRRVDRGLHQAARHPARPRPVPLRRRLPTGLRRLGLARRVHRDPGRSGHSHHDAAAHGRRRSPGRPAAAQRPQGRVRSDLGDDARHRRRPARGRRHGDRHLALAAHPADLARAVGLVPRGRGPGRLHHPRERSSPRSFHLPWLSRPRRAAGDRDRPLRVGGRLGRAGGLGARRPDRAGHRDRACTAWHAREAPGSLPSR